MTHQRTIRTFSPFIISGLLLSLVGPGQAESVNSATAENPTLPAVPVPIPAPDLPSTPAPGAIDTQEESAPTDTMPPSTEEGMSSEAPVDNAESTESVGGAELDSAPEETMTPSPGETPASETPVENAEPTENSGGGELEEEPVSSDPTVVDIATQNEESFSIFLQALEASGLKDALLERTDVTVFMPTNTAFEELPDGVIENLMQEENQALLAKIIAHHVIDGVNASGDLTTQEVTTLANSKAAINVSEEAVNIDEATVIDADITSSNGIVHSIDKVLIPQEIR